MIPETGFTGVIPDLAVSSNGGSPILTLDPYDASSSGSFKLLLEACAVINDEQENCAQSSALEVVVHDPCLKATILASDIQTVMQTPVLGYAELDLLGELGTQWPWTNSVDYDTPDSVGTELCGPLEYLVTDMNGDEMDIVRLSDDMSRLIYEPTLAHAPGGRTIDLKLVARLAWYPDVPHGADEFRVLLQNCKADIDPSLALPRFQDQVIVWGESPRPYAAGGMLDDYVQVPPCEYTFNFEAKMLNPNDDSELLDLPPWFSFNPFSHEFGLEKCGGSNSMSDADCNLSPFSTRYTIVVIATMLEDIYEVVDKSAQFDIIVEVDCGQDFIKFDTASDRVTYQLRSVPEPQQLISTSTQYSLECGMVCRYELDVAYPPLFDFEAQTGTAVLKSDDKALSGT